MKKLLDSILGFFNTNEKEPFHYIKMERNEKCYCNSGKKYKSCHYPGHEKRNSLAVRVIKEISGEESIKVISHKKLRKEHFRVKTTVER